MILNKNAWNICLLSRIKEYSLKNTCLKNVIRQDSKNKWLLLSASLLQNLGWFFC